MKIAHFECSHVRGLFEDLKLIFDLENKNLAQQSQLKVHVQAFPELSTVSHTDIQPLCPRVEFDACRWTQRDREVAFEVVTACMSTDQSPWQLRKLLPLMKTVWYDWRPWNMLVSGAWVGIFFFFFCQKCKRIFLSLSLCNRNLDHTKNGSRPMTMWTCVLQKENQMSLWWNW